MKSLNCICFFFLFAPPWAFFKIEKESLVEQIAASQKVAFNYEYKTPGNNKTLIGAYTKLATPKTLNELLFVVTINELFKEFFINGYPSNHLTKIKCKDGKGNFVWLYPDKNTEFVIRTKSGKKKKVYYDTLILKSDTLIGLRSRIIGGDRIIPLDEIDKVSIYAEFPKVEPY